MKFRAVKSFGTMVILKVLYNFMAFGFAMLFKLNALNINCSIYFTNKCRKFPSLKPI